MLKLKYLSVLVVMLTSMCIRVNAQTYKFQEFNLDNGLHVILYPDNHKPIVNVSVMYNVGSRNEDPKMTGFAHFFEHLMFEGSKYIGRGEYAKLVEKNGGELNANTSQDRTYYFETLPSNQVELGLWMESERMLHAKVESKGIATQKKVVAAEKKQTQDDKPYGDVMSILFHNSFKKSHYHWITIGDVDKLVKAKDSDFYNFYKTYYVPNNACLVVAGDINVKKCKKMVEKYFASIPKGTRSMNKDFGIDPPQTKEKRLTVRRNVQLPLLVEGYHVPGVGDKDTPALDLLASVLAGSNSARLNQHIITDKHLAIQVSLNSSKLRGPGLLILVAMPNFNGKVSVTEAMIDHEIYDVKKNLISEREFQKLRNRLKTARSASHSVQAIANVLARDYTYFKDTNRINEELNKYMAVTRDDIRRVANKYLTNSNRLVMHYVPKNYKEQF